MREFASISVVIPVFNKASTVARAIDSVLAQTDPVDEILVVDDGSTDETPRVLEHFHNISKLKVVRLPENRGVSSARNAGIDLARSEWVAFLDADDFWADHFIAECRSALNSSVDLVGTAYSFLTSENVIDGRFPLATKCLEEVTDYFEWAIEGDLPFTCSSVCVRRQKLQSVGGFPAELAMGEDQVLWLKLLMTGHAFFVNKVLSTYDLSSSSAVSGLTHRFEDPLYIDVLLSLIPDEERHQNAALRKYIAKVCRNSLVYQAAYLSARDIRSFLLLEKVRFLPMYQRLVFWGVGFCPLFIRAPVFLSVIRRFNRKWS